MDITYINDVLAQLKKWDETGIAPTEDTAALVNHVLDEVAPMAEEMGMEPLQQQLLELGIRLGHPEDYRRLKQLLLDSEMMCENVFQTFALPIRSMLDDMGLEYEFKYRMKSVYSIWRKMQNDGKEFDDVYDLFATRIVYKPKPIIDPLPQTTPNMLDVMPEVQQVRADIMPEVDLEKVWCWRIYNIIAMLYRIHPDRIRDWISHPKKSGYQALQMTVMGPDCNWIEIQVRSERMDYEATYGQAAHWKYKQETAQKK